MVSHPRSACIISAVLLWPISEQHCSSDGECISLVLSSTLVPFRTFVLTPRYFDQIKKHIYRVHSRTSTCQIYNNVRDGMPPVDKYHAISTATCLIVLKYCSYYYYYYIQLGSEWSDLCLVPHAAVARPLRRSSTAACAGAVRAPRGWPSRSLDARVRG